VTKNGRKKSEKKILTETHVYREEKTMEKIVWKKCENTFFITTRISGPKNGEEKTREKLFPETHVYRAL